MKILLYEKGYQARVALEIARAMKGVEPVGFAVNGGVAKGATFQGLPVISADDLSSIEHDAMTITVIRPDERHRAHDRLIVAGETLTTLIHPTAVVSPDATIHPGCIICAGCVIDPGCVIKTNTLINTRCTIGPDTVIGRHCSLAQGVNLSHKVVLGNNVTMNIGSCARQQLTIGDHAKIGFGAAVTTNVPDDATATGVPARVV